MVYQWKYVIPRCTTTIHNERSTVDDIQTIAAKHRHSKHRLSHVDVAWAATATRRAHGQTDRKSRVKHLGGPVSRWGYWGTVGSILCLPSRRVLVHGYLKPKHHSCQFLTEAILYLFIAGHGRQMPRGNFAAVCEKMQL